jgi:hypothetical protein
MDTFISRVFAKADFFEVVITLTAAWIHLI